MNEHQELHRVALERTVEEQQQQDIAMQKIQRDPLLIKL